MSVVFYVLAKTLQRYSFLMTKQRKNLVIFHSALHFFPVCSISAGIVVPWKMFFV